jgi:hypothetical protein
MATDEEAMEEAFKDYDLTIEDLLLRWPHLTYAQMQKRRVAYRKNNGLPHDTRGAKPSSQAGPVPKISLVQADPGDGIIRTYSVIEHKLNDKQFEQLIAALTNK